MNAGINWVDVADLKERFHAPLLIEVDGDRSDLAGHLCEVVDVQDEGNGVFTILHVPGGSLPCETRMARGITYDDAPSVV